MEGYGGIAHSCAWSPDGTRIATASAAVTKTVGGRAAPQAALIFSARLTVSFAHF
jgi:hypothetical protein